LLIIFLGTKKQLEATANLSLQSSDINEIKN